MNEKILFGYMTFKDFVCESFAPKQIEFGQNLIDEKWKELDNGFTVTYFKVNGDIFVVLFRQGHVGFGVQYPPKEDINFININTFSELKKNFTFRPRAVGSAGRIFNHVMFVIFDFIKKNQPKEIYFNGSTKDLNSLYLHMVNDKSLTKALIPIGYEYKGEESGKGQDTPVHVFRKV